MPIVLIFKKMRSLAVGDTLVVTATDIAFPSDVRAWCRKTDNELLSLVEEAGEIRAEIRKKH